LQPEGVSLQPEGVSLQAEGVSLQPEGVSLQPEGVTQIPESAYPDPKLYRASVGPVTVPHLWEEAPKLDPANVGPVVSPTFRQRRQSPIMQLVGDLYRDSEVRFSSGPAPIMVSASICGLAHTRYLRSRKILYQMGGGSERFSRKIAGGRKATNPEF
jgi:hypothetical protein